MSAGSGWSIQKQTAIRRLWSGAGMERRITRATQRRMGTVRQRATRRTSSSHRMEPRHHASVHALETLEENTHGTAKLLPSRRSFVESANLDIERRHRHEHIRRRSILRREVRLDSAGDHPGGGHCRPDDRLLRLVGSEPADHGCGTAIRGGDTWATRARGVSGISGPPGCPGCCRSVRRAWPFRSARSVRRVRCCRSIRCVRRACSFGADHSGSAKRPVSLGRVG